MKDLWYCVLQAVKCMSISLSPCCCALSPFPKALVSPAEMQGTFQIREEPHSVFHSMIQKGCDLVQNTMSWSTVFQQKTSTSLVSKSSRRCLVLNSPQGCWVLGQWGMPWNWMTGQVPQQLDRASENQDFLQLKNYPLGAGTTVHKMLPMRIWTPEFDPQNPPRAPEWGGMH